MTDNNALAERLCAKFLYERCLYERSHAFKLGLLHGLKRELGVRDVDEVCPFSAPSSQRDAYSWGFSQSQQLVEQHRVRTSALAAVSRLAEAPFGQSIGRASR